MSSIFDLVRRHAEQQPDKTALVFEGQETSYRTVAEDACRLAGFFHGKGLRPGDTVALLLGNSDTFVIAYFACQAAGVRVLPLNTRLTPREIDYILNHSEAKLLIYAHEFREMVEQLVPSLAHVAHYIHVGGPEFFRGLEFHRIIEEKESIPAVPVNGSDIAVIFYTSGTTGKPKGVLLSHDNCTAVAGMWREVMDMQADERVLIVAPLFHCAAAHVFMLPTLLAGGALVIEKGFSPRQTMNALQNEAITLFFGVPAMYTLLLNQPDIAELRVPHLRLLTYGAAPMPYELIRQVKTLFPDARVQNLYGQTENAPGATTLQDPYALQKVGSVGRPLPGCEVRVVDENGEDARSGQVGEIIIKGPHVMTGYLKNPEATAHALRDGWLFSGDLGRVDEEGFLYIVDRKKDMIIRGGENIYPVEVEETLFEIPQVLEAAVIGVPHAVYGEVPKAYVVRKEGENLEEQEVLAFCRERLAAYKIPADVEFLQALPRNASGKVLKTVLRETGKETY